MVRLAYRRLLLLLLLESLCCAQVVCCMGVWLWCGFRPTHCVQGGGVSPVHTSHLWSRLPLL